MVSNENEGEGKIVRGLLLRHVKHSYCQERSLDFDACKHPSPVLDIGSCRTVPSLPRILVPDSCLRDELDAVDV